VQGFDGQGDVVNGKVNRDTGELGTISGTSFAAAYISGLAALMRAKFPDLTAAGVVQKIEFTAHAPLGVVTNRMGHGVVDPYAALAGDPPTADNPPEAGPARDRRSDLLRLAGVAVFGAIIAAGVVFVRAKR
jgi:membrane-anchored mycosin MYCP